MDNKNNKPNLHKNPGIGSRFDFTYTNFPK